MAPAHILARIERPRGKCCHMKGGKSQRSRPLSRGILGETAADYAEQEKKAALVEVVEGVEAVPSVDTQRHSKQAV